MDIYIYIYTCLSTTFFKPTEIQLGFKALKAWMIKEKEVKKRKKKLLRFLFSRSNFKFRFLFSVITLLLII